MGAAIRVEGVGKRYRVPQADRPQAGYDTLRESVATAARGLVRLGRRPAGRPAAEEFWALNDVSFEVQPGEVVGVIGRNGAGKSTLLKVLSRITRPTTGRVELNGRVGSLLEVGTGFHPELTGRENVYLNGSILGMSRAEVARKFDEIVAFSEVEKFLDTPVKRYSSGMYVRLAFAVAAHLEPEILIVDEVLAVGDVQFQKKCLGKMGQVGRDGRTVLFVSHHMAAVQGLCTAAMMLARGQVTAAGAVADVLGEYLASDPTAGRGQEDLGRRTDRRGDGRVRLVSATLADAAGRRVSEVTCGMDTVFELGYTAAAGLPADALDVGLSVHTVYGDTLFVLYKSYTRSEFRGQTGADGVFACRIPRLPLTPGRYKLGARVTVNGVEADWPTDGVLTFDVIPGDFYGTGSQGVAGATSFLVDGTWEMRQ